MSEAGESDVDGSAVAVVGASGRFPGARTLAEFWRNVRDGIESVRWFTEEELLAAGESPEALADPAYVKAAPSLDDIELFDPSFFGMSPRDASVMDPQHRVFLEVAWAAMEDAGYDVERVQGSVGVFAACGMNAYMMHHLVTNREVMNSVGEWLVRHTGNDANFLATRVSYQMNLTGPSMNVQTACSSSLSAVHLACQSLVSGECDMALAGASVICLPNDRGYFFKEGEILSPDGHCRPFDAGSRGTLFGSGAACVVLKRLSDALKDGDRVLGLVRGSAVNNDGSGKVGYLAPSVDGQARAIAEAIAISGVPAESISYIEAHGTGTAIGDPIEVAALTQAFSEYTERRKFCALGSVKANIGHLGEAAGMASLLKTLLAFEHRQIPPCINYERPNPEIDFDSSPVFVNTELVPWESDGPRRAGITSLGAGGTNVHVIVEEAPPVVPSGPSRSASLLVWSARSAAALERATERLFAHLQDHPDVSLPDVAYTLQVGRKQFSHRRTLVATSVKDALAALESKDPKRLQSHVAARRSPSVVFMFPGGGAQYPGVGEELYRAEPAYRAAMDECLAVLDRDIRDQFVRLVLSPNRDEAAGVALERPTLSLISVFATSYATAKLLASFGIEPVAMIGHSMGEYVAACLAHVMTVKDALAVLVLRGRIFESTVPGGMLSVPLTEAALRPLLGEALSIAAVNGPQMCVASGPSAAIDELERVLVERDVDCTRVRIAVAAHSSALDPFLPEFERFLRTLRLGAPTIPFVSNLTGTWIRPEEATDPAYWVRHLRRAVRFGDGIAEVLRSGERVLVEVGPGRTLAGLARQQPNMTAPTVSTIRHPQESTSDVPFLLQTLGRLWSYGAFSEWSRLHEKELRRRVPLPTYPFERERFWIERGDALAGKPVPKPKVPQKKPDIADWFYLPSWRRTLVQPAASASGGWLIFADRLGVADRLAARFSGETVVRVTPGWAYQKLSEDHYSIRPGQIRDYQALFDALATADRVPSRIVHLWALVAKPRRALMGSAWTELSHYDETRELCFDSLLFVAKVFGESERPATLTVVSNDLCSVADEPVLHPTRALLTGPVRVIPREMPHLRTRHVDLRIHPSLDATVDCLVTELLGDVDAPTVAYRGSARYVRSCDPVRLEARGRGAPVIRHRGVYLITGGLGGIGLEVALHLAKTAKARLVLIGRSPVPQSSTWEDWLLSHGETDRTSQRILKLRMIEAAGGEILTLAADVTDRSQMEGVYNTTKERFGAVHGVIHGAGVIDDGLIALKTPEGAAPVIDTKAKGALILRALFERSNLDFFVVFSSVSSILGLEGQIDYTAANAFLDAFAHQESKVRTLSINWNAWQEVGMAVALADKPKEASPASIRHAPHPMLSRVVSHSQRETVLSTAFSRAEHWLLSEHVVRGADAVIPGTGYLELARAALELSHEPRPVEITDVHFLSPFSVRIGESRELTLRLLRADGDVAEFSFVSEDATAPHAIGKVAYADAAAPRRVDLKALLGRCSASVRNMHGFLEQPFVDFGPRWGNIRSIATGDGQAVIGLELPAEYANELHTLHLHPALLDMATGAAQTLVPGFDQAKDFYVPFSYGRILLHRGLPAKAWSHVRLKSAAKNLVTFDVIVYDEEGTEVLSVTDFAMKRVDDPATMKGALVRAAHAKVTRVGAVLQQGISLAEGMEAFDRILSSGVRRQIVACTVDLADWLSNIEAEARPRASASSNSESEGTDFARPTLSTTYVAPRDDIERELAALWRELLGLKEVGIYDDFFELGGQSLIAVRLFGRIRKRYSVDLPLSTLFEATTIADCAAIVREEAGLVEVEDKAPASEAPRSFNGASHSSNGASQPPPSGTSVPQKKSRWTSLVAMQPKGTGIPFFCVAGMGGTLNNLRKLALLLGDGRPVYGLQPPGAADGQERLYRVEELASHYIREIRRVQPHGPYLLGGYSGGGVAAFEMSKQLEKDGEAVAALAFLDSFSPALPLRPLKERAEIHLRRAQRQGVSYVVNTIERRLAHQTEALKLRMSRQLERLFSERYRYEALQDSWMVAERQYRPLPWSGKATLFRAREESAVSLWTAVEVSEQHGWERYVRGGVEVVIIPGDHETMCEEPHVRVLAQKLRETLDAAAREVSTPTPSARGVESQPPAE